MKRIIALICTAVLITTVCCGCSLIQKKDDNPPQTSSSASATQAPAATQAETAQAQETAAPVTQAPADDAVGALSDYVVTAKQAQVNGKTFRLPEILLDSDDADAANSAIMEKFGDCVDDPETHNYVSELDYEAYLNGKVLSVLVTGKFDGGNTYGQCYSFDVTTGSELTNEALCSMTGRDYDTAIGTLKTNLTSYYDDKYSNLPANDGMRSQTLADNNVSASKMYLGASDNLMAMVQIYAAVGGGQWVATIAAE